MTNVEYFGQKKAKNCSGNLKFKYGLGEGRCDVGEEENG